MSLFFSLSEKEEPLIDNSVSLCLHLYLSCSIIIEFIHACYLAFYCSSHIDKGLKMCAEISWGDCIYIVLISMIINTHTQKIYCAVLAINIQHKNHMLHLTLPLQENRNSSRLVYV